jgi:DNA-binding NarL/FixJ family response regulator
LLADDHRIVAEGIRRLLEPEFQLVAVVEDGRALIEAAAKLRPQVVVSDITMPNCNGIDALIQLRKDNPSIKVVFLTMHQDAAFARQALEAGAAGFVLKASAPAELISAIREVLKGNTFVSPVLAGEVIRSFQQNPTGRDPVAALTSRQRQILEYLVQGKSAKEIGQKLGISARTVEFHKYHLMECVGVKNTAELIQFAIKRRLTGD